MKFLLCISLFLMCIIVHGQELDSHLQEVLTIKNGLPSDEIYHVIQDKNKFLWIATENGIAKYDGNTFKIFNTKDGLPNNTVFRFYPQPDGKIYGEALENQYFYIENDSIHLYPFNDTITKYLKGIKKCFSFFIDSLSNAHFGSFNGHFVINKQGNYIDKETYDYDLKKTIARKIFVAGNYLFSYEGLALPKLNERYIVLKWGSQKTKTFSIRENETSFESDYPTIFKNYIATTYNKSVYLIDTSEIFFKLTFNKPPIGLYSSDTLIWVCTKGEGVYSYRFAGNKLLLKDHLLDGYSVTSVLKDHENGYWFSTRETGLVHYFDFQLKKIYNSIINQNISSFYKNNNINLIGYDNGYLDNTIAHSHINFPSKIYKIDKLINNEIIMYVGFYQRRFLLDGKGKLKVSHLKFIDDMEKCIDLQKINDSLLLINSLKYFSVYNYKAGKKIYSSPLLEMNDRIFSIKQFDHQILIGTKKGLKVYSALNYSFLRTFPLPSTIVKIISVDEANLMIACRNGELFSYNKSGLEPVSLTYSEKINRIFDFTYADSTLYIINSLGIEKYRYVKQNKLWDNYASIALPGILKIKEFNDTIYYVTRKEIYADYNENKTPKLPILNSVSLKVNNSSITIDSNLVFRYFENNIQFQLSTISFDKGIRKFKYKLVGVDQDYLFTTNPIVNYAVLNPGDYEFIVSSTINGIDFSYEHHVYFTILQPFWKTTFFILSSILIVLLGIFLFYKRQVNIIRTNLAVKENIAKLRSQALTSQLNPHLVFNILNSIQGIISEGDTEKANIYLAKFSKFMRVSLSLSKQSTISLDEEIKITKSYIELELLRFPENVTINLISNTTNSKFHLPPLTIQEFIENAIKHGIMPSKNKNGEINVIINTLNDYLQILIEDNGIGFNGPLDYSKGDGLRIAMERLKIQNSKNAIVLNSDEHITRVELNIY